MSPVPTSTPRDAVPWPHHEPPLAGPYMLGGLLGHGGMGLVREGLHVGRREKVAVKLLRADYAHVSEARERFLREASSLGHIDDPHVVRVLDHGETDDGRPFFVMELLDGVCLAALAQRRALEDVSTIVELVRQATLGLAAAHRAGVVHRDLKPQNLMVTADERGAAHVKLLDFGIASRTDAGLDELRLTQTEVVLGTPVYMSPEQIRAPRDADARSDVFSMGVVLYELLTERMPWHATSAVDLVVRQLTEAPVPVDVLRGDVPPGLASIVARCLEMDPAARFADGAELATALAPFARPVDAGPLVVDDDLEPTVVRESQRPLALEGRAPSVRPLPSIFSEAPQSRAADPARAIARPADETHRSRAHPRTASRGTVIAFVLAAILAPPAAVIGVRVLGPAVAAHVHVLAR